jgi:hypothetical protein
VPPEEMIERALREAVVLTDVAIAIEAKGFG